MAFPSDRIYGTIYGNCIGDAIGLLTEFMTKKEAKKYYDGNKDLEFKDKVPDMHRSRWKDGDWTDDSDQMILMMQSILELNGEVKADDYGKKLKHWVRHGFPELGDYGGMGIGATTLHVLKHPQFDADPHSAAKQIWEKTGCEAAPNGAVMRTSLMGIYQYDDLDKVTDNTREFCKVTHADYRCQASCVAVTRAIALMLQGQCMKSEKKKFDIEAIIKESFEHARNYIPAECTHQKEYIEELKFHMYAKSLKDLKLDEYKKIGYTYKTLGAGFWALRQKDFRQALQAIVMEAGDADTNGAVAGALLGCKLGVDGLPHSWLQGLVHKKWLDDIIYRFLELAFPKPGKRVRQLAEGISSPEPTGLNTDNQDEASSTTEQPDKTILKTGTLDQPNSTGEDKDQPTDSPTEVTVPTSEEPDEANVKDRAPDQPSSSGESKDQPTDSPTEVAPTTEKPDDANLKAGTLDQPSNSGGKKEQPSHSTTDVAPTTG